MAVRNIESATVKRISPLRLLVASGVEETGNNNFGGYRIYLIKVPLGSTIPNINNLDPMEELEFIGDIIPEWSVSYSGYSVDKPIQRANYSPNYIYPYHYYNWESNLDHYFYLTAFDKTGNVNSGLVSHNNNPVPTPNIRYALEFKSIDADIKCIDNDNTRFWGDGDIVLEGTISCLFKPTIELALEQLFGSIISKQKSNDSTAMPFNLIAYYHNNVTKGRLIFYVGDGYNETYVATGNILNKDQIYHIICTFREYVASKNKYYELRIYLDGILNAEEPAGFIGLYNYAYGTDGSLRIGHGNYDASKYYAASGIVGDFRIYNYTFTPNQASGLYNQITSGYVINPELESGLLFHSNLVEGTGVYASIINYGIHARPQQFYGTINWVSDLMPTIEEDINPSHDLIHYIKEYTISGNLLEYRDNLLPYRFSTFTVGQLPSGIAACLKKPAQSSGLHSNFSAAKFTTDTSSSTSTSFYFSESSGIYNILFNSGISNKLIIDLKYRWDRNPN